METKDAIGKTICHKSAKYRPKLGQRTFAMSHRRRLSGVHARAGWLVGGAVGAAVGAGVPAVLPRGSKRARLFGTPVNLRQDCPEGTLR